MKIAVVGSSNTDMILKVPRIPKPGETILGGTFATAAGGKGANQAVTAARAGGEVSFIARVGDDMFGAQAVSGFEVDNINVDYVLTDPKKPSGVALIYVDECGENSIGVASGANAGLSPGDVSEAAAAALLQRGVEVVIITLGKQGAFVKTKNLSEAISGFEVEAVDATAAGDVFNGSLSVALAEGKPLQKAVRFANAAAALSVTKLGAQPSAPGRKEIQAFLDQN